MAKQVGQRMKGESIEQSTVDNLELLNCAGRGEPEGNIVGFNDDIKYTSFKQ